MLSPRQNMYETVIGGNPDRYVNQFEALKIMWCTPQNFRYPGPEYGGEPLKDCWGVTKAWPEGTPGEFPVQDEEHIVLRDDDMENWRDFIKMPSIDFTEEEWAPIIEEANAIDRSQYYATIALWPGIFETCHNLMKMEDCMMNLYEEPEIMQEIIDYIAQYELDLAEQVCKYLKPDAVYRHDDWGSQISTFMSKDMFREFFLEPTKKIYQYYKDHGVELIIHHSDSYCETFVPEMIEMGIDVWQGALSTNDLPKIAKEYKGKLTVMGGIDNGKIDRVDWTPEKVAAEVNKIVDWVDSPYFIPDMTFGGDVSTYDGVYDEVTKCIEEINKNR